ncbi:MAG: hypothetical protein FWD37_03365 [Methanomassiliicoccaceae archaeon]|nr:hypothetical protein [Methanomassiliicoccaceae archaeon]
MSTCRTLAVVHGRSELIFCKGIASNLKINMEYDSDNRGGTCIQIMHLEERFTTGCYVSENALHKRFDKLEYLGRRIPKMPHLKIFPIMDTDDCRQQERAYRTGNMFADSVFKDRISPIFNTPDLDPVLIECGFRVDRNDKYHDLVKEYELSDLIGGLKNCENTNICVLLEHCASITPSYQSG